MGLQSWRNFVVIQHCDRDKLGTITSVHPPSSIDPVNLERKDIIFHPRFSSIKEEEKGLKQVGFKSLIHHSYRFFNKFIGRRVKNFYLLKGVTFSPCPFVPSNPRRPEFLGKSRKLLATGNVFARDKSSNKRSMREGEGAKSSNSRDTTRHWVVNSNHATIPRALT